MGCVCSRSARVILFLPTVVDMGLMCYGDHEKCKPQADIEAGLESADEAGGK